VQAESRQSRGRLKQTEGERKKSPRIPRPTRERKTTRGAKTKRKNHRETTREKRRKQAVISQREKKHRIEMDIKTWERSERYR